MKNLKIKEHMIVFSAMIIASAVMLAATSVWAVSSGVLAQETSVWQSLGLVFSASGIVGVFAAVIRQRYAIIKRISDIAWVSLGLLVVSPVLVTVIAIIKLTSKGPAIYTQERVGKGGRIFKMYKLRSMVVNAEEFTGPVWAQENDPRVTWIGRILRKTRLDEIPQFFNILKGEMSLIGPRPERPEFVARLSREIEDYPKRLDVAPGITGLAQVWSKYDETVQDVRRKVKYDLLYIRQMCLTADLGILFRTVYVVATGQGAR